METKVVTIKDIAADLGVSLTTVHKVIYNKKGVSDATRKRVMDYIQKSGFHINRAASALKRRLLRLAYVGIELPGAGMFFFQKLNDAVAEAYEELKPFNVELEIFTTSENADEQYALLEKLLEERRGSLDGLLLTCAHEHRCAPVIRRFADAGIPVVTVSSDAKTRARSAYVGADSVTIGHVAAELVYGLGIPQNGRVLLVSGYREYSNHQAVSSSFADFLTTERPDVEIIDLYQSTSIEATEVKIRRYLTAFPDISCAYAATARSTYALCCAIRSLGLSGKLKVVGMDVFEELRPFFADRTIWASLFQDPRRQASLALTALYNIVSQEQPVAEEQFVNIGIAIQSNFDYFL